MGCEGFEGCTTNFHIELSIKFPEYDQPLSSEDGRLNHLAQYVASHDEKELY